MVVEGADHRCSGLPKVSLLLKVGQLLEEEVVVAEEIDDMEVVFFSLVRNPAGG